MGTPTKKTVRYGFEYEDVNQEFALGKILSRKRRPDDGFAAYQRGKTRAARHRKKEREWNQIRVPIMESDKEVANDQFEKALLHEILDMLPYALKEDALRALLADDGRMIRRVAREIRETLPNL